MKKIVFAYYITVLCTGLAVTNVDAASYYRYQNTTGGTLFTNKPKVMGEGWRLIHQRNIHDRAVIDGDNSRTFSYNHTAISPSGTLGFMHFGDRQRLLKKRDPSCGEPKITRNVSGLTTISIRSCAPKIPFWASRGYGGYSDGYYRNRAPSISSSTRKMQFNDLIAEAAHRHQVDERLVHAVIQTESAYNAHAVSRAGAVGLMQLMPDTARRYGVFDRHDPNQNIDGGTKYLKYLLGLFNSLDLAIAAYNAGENAVMRHGYSIPPYPETQNYVRQVLSRYRNL